ncbi:MAG: AAA family ATPase [Polyangiaceae bacterium]
MGQGAPLSVCVDQEGPGARPTADEPLLGLAHLAKVAVIGRERIVELASRRVVYVWQDIAILGIVVVVAGGPGSGKTTLLFLIIAARLNRGCPVLVLGRTVTPAPTGTYVVVIEAEHSDSSAARKLVQSCRLLGVDEAALDRVILVARRSVRIGSPEWVDVETLISAGLVSDVLLDTLARVAPADANSEQEQVAIFDRIAKAIECAPSAETRPVVWVAAHTRKGEAVRLDDVSGSAQRTGQADTVILVNAEKRDGRVVSSKVVFDKLREDPETWPAPVEYTVARDRVVSVGTPTEDSRPLEQRILERLALGPQTKNGLRQALGRNANDLESAVTNLFGEKAISATTVRVRGHARRAFVLRDEAVQEGVG